MAYYKTGSQKCLWWLLWVSILFTIAAGVGQSSYDPYNYTWKMWFIAPVSFFVLYLCGKYPIENQLIHFLFLDVMFMDENSFIFEPTSYAHWRDATESNY